MLFLKVFRESGEKPKKRFYETAVCVCVIPGRQPPPPLGRRLSSGCRGPWSVSADARHQGPSACLEGKRGPSRCHRCCCGGSVAVVVVVVAAAAAPCSAGTAAAGAAAAAAGCIPAA